MKSIRSFSAAIVCILSVSYVQPAMSQESDTAWHFIVAPDGSGHFTSIQDAVNAVPDMRRAETRILVRKGVYREKVVIAESKQGITLVGESADSTLLVWNDYAAKPNRFGEEMGTSGSATLYVYAPDFTARNLTIANDAGPVGQAVAVLVAGDRARFIDCRLLGHQDTLYTYSPRSRQYYLRCYIAGTVDFIFGASTAVFDSCVIFGKRGGYYTAASTPADRAFGYVFRNCRFTGDAPAGSFYLGRPWRPFARTVLLHCYLDEQVKPEGWHNWNKPEAEATAFYAEYQSSGPGASVSARVPWSKQLTEKELTAYSLTNMLDGWQPMPGRN